MRCLALALALIALLATPVSAQIISYASPLPTVAGGTGTTGGGINGSAVVRSGDKIGFSSSATDATVACDVCFSRVSSTVGKVNTDFRVDTGLGVGAAPTGTAGDINIVSGGRISLGNNSRTAGPLIATDDTTRAQIAGGTNGIRFLSAALADIADLSNTGGLTLGAIDNTSDLGTSALRIRTGYFGTSLNLGTAPTFFAAAPTISSGFGTSPSVVAGGTATAFRVNVGTGGTATSGVVGMPTATTAWNCFVEDQTTANLNTRQTASNTTTVTFGTSVAWAASDILIAICGAN